MEEFSMRKRRFLSILTIVFFLITFVTPINTGVSSPLSLPEYTSHKAGIQSVQGYSDNDVVRLEASETGDKMLQFKAGGHVLGFQANKAYVAGLDHALTVEFRGTAGVMPIAESAYTAQPLINLNRTAERISGAKPLSKVIYQNLWKGINLTYSSSKSGITESTYHIEPGAEVSNIRFRYNVPAEIQKDGSLKLTFSSGFLTESAPVAWQEIDGKSVPVKVSFRVSKNEIGFKVAKYDSNFPLTIDPTYQWHTFYGSSTYSDSGKGIAVDGSGNVYVTGTSYELWTGPGGEAPLYDPFSGNRNNHIFVLKLNTSGAYQWHTFYGSTGEVSNFSNGIAVDSSGNVYITGHSNATWNGPNITDTPLHAFTGGYDIFVLKLDTNGAYQWHTFYGAAATYDGGEGIAVDSSGNVYVTGNSSATWNGPNITDTPLHAFTGSADIVVLKLNTNGAYGWHTFYGSSLAEFGYGIAVDSSGNVYVSGHSAATWNGPNITDTPLHAFTVGSGYDIFVIKLDTNGAYQWHTFYGSTNSDESYGLAVDGSGNVYVTGDSAATWDGPGGEPPLNDPFTGLNLNIVVLKLDTDGVYQWHTFYGAAGAGSNDLAQSIAVNIGGNVYVTGYSYATWDGPGPTPPLNPLNGSNNIFVLKLNTGGAYGWHTFYGAGSNNSGLHIAVDSGPGVYVSGYSDVSWNGPGGVSPLNDFNGNNDIVVLKMSDDPPATTVPTMNEWGIMIFMILAGIGSVFYLRKKRKLES
jgi:hypothetical protein